MPSWLHGTEEFGFAHTYHLYSFVGWAVGVAKPKPYLFSLCVSYMYNFKSYYMLRRCRHLQALMFSRCGATMVVLDFIAMGCGFVPLASCVCDC